MRVERRAKTRQHKTWTFYELEQKDSDFDRFSYNEVRKRNFLACGKGNVHMGF